ncbi:MAG TPA: hypothetical protein VHT73_16690 [Thermodesulfobacteriota bacterium]|nr:hypothetical protein [Thermodesulfobacteriota bacterium]
MRNVSITLIAVSMLFAISLFIIGCDDDNNGIQPELGSDISRACAGQFDGFIGGISRGSTCLCEGEFRGEFSLELGPAPDPEDPLIITMGEAASEGGRTIFGVEEKGGSTFSLFNVEPDPDVDGGLTLVGDPVGELQNLIEGISSLEFVIQLGDDPPERVFCPACAIAEVCDVEKELDKPKCLDTETLVDTGSSCPADSIVRVCDPFLCGAEVVVEETGEIISVDFITLPFESSVALGCNTVNESGIYYTNIENIPPSGTYIESATREGTFSCELSPSPPPTP